MTHSSLSKDSSNWQERLRGFVTAVLFLAVGMLACMPAYGQCETASVLGFVHDTSGAAIPEAKVTLINVATGQQVTVAAGSQGEFEFTSVCVGEYKMNGASSGFSATTTEAFTVEVNARQRVDVTLKPGSATETVTVTGAAALLNTEDGRAWPDYLRARREQPSSERSRICRPCAADSRRSREQPRQENQTVTSRDASYNVNGQRSEFNNFMLDEHSITMLTARRTRAFQIRQSSPRQMLSAEFRR